MHFLFFRKRKTILAFAKSSRVRLFHACMISFFPVSINWVGGDIRLSNFSRKFLVHSGEIKEWPRSAGLWDHYGNYEWTVGPHLIYWRNEGDMTNQERTSDWLNRYKKIIQMMILLWCTNVHILQCLPLCHFLAWNQGSFLLMRYQQQTASLHPGV